MRELIRRTSRAQVLALARRIRRASSLGNALAGNSYEALTEAEMERLQDLVFEQVRPFLSGRWRTMARREWLAEVRPRPLAASQAA